MIGLPDFMKDVHTCYPAKVTSFDPKTQLADVVLLIERYYSSATEMMRPVSPLTLVDVPVHVVQCKDYALTMPIKVGDECLVHFAEKGIEHWLYSGSAIGGVDEDGIYHHDFNQKFSVNNALVTVGYNSVPRAVPNYNADDMMLRSKDDITALTISDAGIVISRNEVDDEGTDRVVTPVSTITVNDAGVHIRRTNDEGTTSIVINDSGIQVNTTNSCNVYSEADLSLATNADMYLSASGSMNLDASGDMNLTASTINMN